MKYEAKILADSIAPNGVRVVTIQGQYPRFIHAEVLRHRVQSHSVMSSRAVPTEVYIDMVRKDMFIPETFTNRVKGMGFGSPLEREDAQRAVNIWTDAGRDMARAAERLMDLNVDKSRANRLLEAFLPCVDIITATEWSNFLALRQPDHGDVPSQEFPAQPEFQIFARMCRDAMSASTPRELGYDEWHMPKIDPDEEIPEGYADLAIASSSAGRCAKVSFATHERTESIPDSFERQIRLVGDAHWSPSEHPCRPMHPDDVDGDGVLSSKIMVPADYAHAVVDPSYELDTSRLWCGNLRGFIQLRKLYELEHDRGAWLDAHAEAV